MESKNTQHYFPVTSLKFSLMSICTLGIYTIYWNYKNWRFIEDRDHAGKSPFWRSIFFPIWLYSLLTDISNTTKNDILGNDIYKAFLAVSVLALGVCSKLPDPYWLVSIFTFVPILPAVFAISELNTNNDVDTAITSHRPLNFIAYLIGGPLVVSLTLSVIGFFPSTMVVTGNQIWDKDLSFLRSENILAEDEKILYFYSFGMWSIKGDGQFISEDYVTSYFVDPDENSLFTSHASYEDIKNIDVTWSNSWLEDTIVTITTTGGDVFELWISAESGGDKKFVNEMSRLWKIKRKENVNSAINHNKS